MAYTESETEIFWQRANNRVFVTGYDIIRNGVVLTRSLDTLSYYDNTVESGVSYEYQVIAVNPQGRRSTAAAVTVATPAAYSTINADNYLALTGYLFSIANGSFTKSSVNFVENFTVNDVFLSEGFSLLSSRFEKEASRVFTEYGCTLAGTYVNSPSGSSTGGEFGEFNQCEYGDTHVNGTYNVSNSISSFVFNPGLTTDISYNLLRSNPAIEIIGSSSDLNGQYQQVQSWNLERFSTPSLNGATLITNFSNRITTGSEPNESFEAAPFQASMLANFNIQSPETGNKPITYATIQTLVKSTPDGEFTSGVITATGNDGSSLTIEFDNSNPNSADVTVTSDELTFTESLQISEYW